MPTDDSRTDPAVVAPRRSRRGSTTRDTSSSSVSSDSSSLQTTLAQVIGEMRTWPSQTVKSWADRLTALQSSLQTLREERDKFKASLAAAPYADEWDNLERERDELTSKLAHAEAVLYRGEHVSEPTKTCEWSHADDDTDLWEGTCGVAWSLSDGTPEENEMRFCPRCGGKLKVIRPRRRNR